MYTPIIQQSDLTTLIYIEKLNAVTRGDTTIIPKQINAAINEVQSYLTRFSLPALFGDPIANTAATVYDEWLNNLCKDVAAWHMIKLGNCGIDMTVIRTGYEDAIATLKRIQGLKQTPQNWPLLNLDTIKQTPGNPVEIKGRRKRGNNY